MGYNSSKRDKEAYYNNRTLKQLQAEVKQFEEALVEWDGSGIIKHPPAFYNEHIQYLRMKIAERIINNSKVAQR